MLDKIRENLEKEYNEICDNITIYRNNRNILQYNTTDSKLAIIGIVGMFSIIPSIVASSSIMAPLISTLALPATATMGIALASSIAIGYVGQAIITSVTKRMMKKFTRVKTSAYILEEMMHYEIEIDKSKKKKEVLEKIYKRIDSKQQLQNECFDQKRSIDTYEKITHSDLKKMQLDLTAKYQKRIEELDILTTQSYLIKKIALFRKKKDRIFNVITGCLHVGLLFSLFIGIPLSFELTGYTTINNFANLGKLFAILFSPILATAPLSIPFFIKRNKQYMNVYNNLNKQLGEKALHEKNNIGHELNNMITKKIDELVELGIDLKEISYVIEKRNSETTVERGEERGKYLFRGHTQSINTTPEQRDDIVKHPERYWDLPYRLKRGLFHTDSEKGKALKRRLGKKLP